MEATCFIEIFIGIKMNSNNSNHSDGSYHEYLDEKPRTKDGKLIEEKKTKIETIYFFRNSEFAWGPLFT